MTRRWAPACGGCLVPGQDLYHPSSGACIALFLSFTQLAVKPVVIALYVVAALFALRALFHLFAVRRCLRERRRGRATWRSAWLLLTLALALLFGISGTLLEGYHRLGDEALVATVTTRQLAPQRYAVDITLPDGSIESAELEGDQWQLDARVVKWRSTALLLGAEPLYRLDRISGRFARIGDPARTATAVDLAGDRRLELARLQRRFPEWLSWIDADFGSAAFLPMVDGGRYTVTLATAGGLVARPADDATAQRIREIEW